MSSQCELHRVADLARTMRPSGPSRDEVLEQIAAPPAIGEVLHEVLTEATWPNERPLRVPNAGGRDEEYHR